MKKTRLVALMRWLGHTFETSHRTTPEFKKFTKAIRSCFKGLEDFELVKFNRGHFYFSAFFKNLKTNKIVYVSCSDVRYSPDGWHNNLLVRTVAHEEDYIGGTNNYTSLLNLETTMKRLTQ